MRLESGWGFRGALKEVTVTLGKSLAQPMLKLGGGRGGGQPKWEAVLWSGVPSPLWGVLG